MKGLQTARVVVIDDDEKEAMPLIKGLSQLRIGTVYFSGYVDELPSEPLTGIRIVFLDLRLMSGPSAEPKHYIPQTINVLAKVVEAGRGVTGIVCWTKYEDDIDELRKRIPDEIPDFQPAFLLKISNKSQFLKKFDESDVPKKLQAGIEEVLENRYAHRVLWDWEQGVHDAASATTSLLSDVATIGNNNARQQDDLLALLAALAVASAGKTITDEVSAMIHLFEGLNPVHYDQLEQVARGKGTGGTHVQKLAETATATPNLPPQKKAHLNRVILAAEPERKPHPGNVYLAKGWNGAVPFPLPSGGPDLEPEANPIKPFVEELWLSKKNKVDRLLSDAVTCLVEITPSCDHAQEKMQHSRLLGGVLLKSDERLPKDSRLFGQQLPVMHLEDESFDLSGDYSLVLNARYLFWFQMDEMKQHFPAFRLRHQIVADIRAWFASHAARPGFISV